MNRLSIALLAAALAGSAALSAGERYNINPGWRLAIGDVPGAENPKFDDSAWKTVTLPAPTTRTRHIAC